MTTLETLQDEPLNVLWNAEYIGISFADRDLRIWAEAFPFEGDIGPVYFRHGTSPYAMACKMSQETWEAFFARQNRNWEAFPFLQRLAIYISERCAQ